MADSSVYPDPLFILGAPRSFTSLICAMIGQHPEIYGVPELNLFAVSNMYDFNEKFTGYRQIQQHGLLRAVSQIYAGEQNLLTLNMARRWVLARINHPVADVYRELCHKVAPLRIADKSPIYTQSMDSLTRIRETFPNAKFLHLLRHPVTFGKSIMNIVDGVLPIMANSIDYSVDPPVVDPQIMWFDLQKNISRALADVPSHRKLFFRGEDFLNDREAGLKSLCDWLDIRSDATAIEAMLHPEDSPYAELGPLGAHLGNDINFLRAPALREGKIAYGDLDTPLPWRPDGSTLHEEVVKMARGYGYQ